MQSEIYNKIFGFSNSYGSGTLTTVFLDRVFAECHTYNGEMDYKAYLDFVLALENRHEPQALHYLFRILDFEHTGYLTAFSLNYFFKGITDQIVAHRAERVDFEDVKDQVFDMVKPKDPLRITLKDLINWLDNLFLPLFKYFKNLF